MEAQWLMYAENHCKIEMISSMKPMNIIAIKKRVNKRVLWDPDKNSIMNSNNIE